MDANGRQKLRDPRKNVSFKGTVRYCSLNVHRREEHGRHDDLWSLLYMLIEMLQGELPWRNMERGQAERCKESSEKRLISSCPREFVLILKHLRKLNYTKVPDYELIGNAFQQILRKRAISPHAPLDWEPNGRHGRLFRSMAVTSKPATKVKTADERRELDHPTISSDLNTKCDASDIDENDYNLDDDEGASHVSGKSATDDTLKKLDDIK